MNRLSAEGSAEYSRIGAPVSTLLAQCGLINLHEATVPWQELALILTSSAVECSLMCKNGSRAHHHVDFKGEVNMQGLEAIKSGFDTKKGRNSRAALEALDSLDVLGLLSVREVSPGVWFSKIAQHIWRCTLTIPDA